MPSWTLVGLALMGSVCLWRAISGLRTGVFSWEQGGGTDYYASRREAQPRRFWLGIALYGLIAIGCLGAIGISAYRRYMGFN